MSEVSFEEVMDSISDGTDLPVDGQPTPEAEERVTPEDSVKDDDTKPVGEPESEAKDEEKDPPEEAPPEDKPADKEESEEKPESKDEEKPPKEEKETPPEEVTFEVDGEQVTLAQIKAWRKEAEDGGLRLDDYTRKTQSASEARTKALEMQESNATLAEEISKDPGLQKLLAARPESLQYLMRDPAGTRSMIGNPAAVEQFWGAMDAINDNPLLAEKFRGTPEPSEAEALLREENEVKNVKAIVGTLDMTIDAAAKEFFPQVDPEKVKSYVASLSGMPENPTHQDWVSGADRLYHLFFKTVDGQAELNPQLLEVEFARLQSQVGKASEEAPPAEEVNEHNEAVDRQLKAEEPPPKTPDGAPPVAEPEKPVQYKDFQEALADI